MGPVRTEKRKRRDETRNSQDGVSELKRQKKRPKLAHESSGGSGIQKLKSSLRQTRRLLAKDNLAADVRVETERRLKSLEADLANAESAKKERTLAVRYHKVKFFERQKVVRKLNQAKKNLAAVSDDEIRKKRIETTISDLRVDLNYVLHYPKTKKYISLFPPEVRQRESKTVSTQTESETDVAREEVRSWIRGQMEKGELSLEPELHLDSKVVVTNGGHKAETWDSRGGSGTGMKKLTKTPASQAEDDAFFGDDDEENQGQKDQEGQDQDQEESSESGDDSDEDS